MQEIIQNIATLIHDDPISIILPFELLIDEEISDDFLRDTIESIARYYFSRYPGDVYHIKMNTRWFNNIVCYNYIKSLHISD